jgi:hypothetical protein
MNKIIYLNEVPLLKKILGYSIVVLGLLSFTASIVFGAIFIAIGINFLLTEGSEIDLDNVTYRSIHSR